MPRFEAFTGTDGDWDALLTSLPGAHALQASPWARLKHAYGWDPSRWITRDEAGTIRAAALLLTRPVQLPGPLRRTARLLPRRSIGYLPRGPIVDASLGSEEAEPVWRSTLTGLHQQAKAARSIFLKLDPEIPAGAPQEAWLRSAGFRPSRDQIQYRVTYDLDLTQPEDALRRAMSKAGRTHLNRSAREGVMIRTGSVDDLDAFHRLYAETALRQRFLTRPRDYYRLAWRGFLEAGLARLYLAEWQGHLVAGALVYQLGDQAWYLYGASSDSHREVRPNEALQWHILTDLKERGVRRYDLWGAPSSESAGAPMAGVAQFKRSLGGHRQEWLGAWDLVIDPALYRAWTRLLPGGLGLARRILRLPDATLPD